MVGGTLVARWCRRTACVVGAVTFLAGFVGPLILWPDNNLGPLLGIFLTGPLGFVGGAVIGLCIGLAKERRQCAGALPETNVNMRR
jgi:F0F1-type ATP synthase assembly protein I